MWLSQKDYVVKNVSLVSSVLHLWLVYTKRRCIHSVYANFPCHPLTIAVYSGVRHSRKDTIGLVNVQKQNVGRLIILRGGNISVNIFFLLLLFTLIVYSDIIIRNDVRRCTDSESKLLFIVACILRYSKLCKFMKTKCLLKHWHMQDRSYPCILYMFRLYYSSFTALVMKLFS